MRVFVLGGTGSVGSAIVDALVARSHVVTALSRSEASDNRLKTAGAVPLRGDLARSDTWANVAAAQDCVIQAAATFDDSMGNVDAAAMTALARAAASRDDSLRLLYTGGCWLYGETGDKVATEATPFAPIPAFGWMLEQAEMLLAAPGLSTAILHPAMVYHAEGGGVFDRFQMAAQAGKPLEIWGGPHVRWPLIERTDLGRAYCALAERPDLRGHFNAVAEQGVPVERVAKAVARAHGLEQPPITRTRADLVAEYGDWAEGPCLDQQMSADKLRRATGWQPRLIDFRQTPGILAAKRA